MNFAHEKPKAGRSTRAEQVAIPPFDLLKGVEAPLKIGLRDAGGFLKVCSGCSWGRAESRKLSSPVRPVSVHDSRWHETVPGASKDGCSTALACCRKPSSQVLGDVSCHLSRFHGTLPDFVVAELQGPSQSDDRTTCLHGMKLIHLRQAAQ